MMEEKRLKLNREQFAAFWERADAEREYALRVSGNSMYPFLIGDTSVVYIVKQHSYALRPGDLLLYRRQDGSFVLHRLYALQEDGDLWMNGDRQHTLERVPLRAVCAKVTRHFVRRRRDIRVDGIAYRAAVFLWRGTLRLRPALFAAGRAAARILGLSGRG